MKTRTVVVIGSGPAGLFATKELELAGIDVVLLEKGKMVARRRCPMTIECIECTSCHEVDGVGGAGGFSDGKLCNGPVGISKDILGGSYQSEVQKVNQTFQSVLGAKYQTSPDKDFFYIYEQSCEEVTQVIPLGSSVIRFFFDEFFKQVKVEKVLNCDVVHVAQNEEEFVVTTKTGESYKAKYIFVATGKCDFSLRNKIKQDFSLEMERHFPTFGVRLEVPNEQITNLKTKGTNPKVKKFYAQGEYVKTHCFCYAGEVIGYKCGPYFLVGGRSDTESPTKLSNVNILYKSNSPETTDLILKSLTAISHDYPNNTICQDLSSFLNQASDTQRKVHPRKSEIFSDFAKYYPEHIFSALQDFLNYLLAQEYIEILGGIVHGPSAEWIMPKTRVSPSGETSSKNLFFIGDTSGNTQGIISAAVMGVRAANEVIKRENKKCVI